MIDALIGGRVHGKPAERTSSNGNRFATAKVRVPTRTGETLFVNVIAFDDGAVTALLALADGDSVAIAGELTPKVYAPPNGEARPSLDLLAHSVLSPYQVTRKRASRPRGSSMSEQEDERLDGSMQQRLDAGSPPPP